MTFAAGPSGRDVDHLPDSECGELVGLPEGLTASNTSIHWLKNA